MKQLITLLALLTFTTSLLAQNVGIGITNPQDPLHLQNTLRIEGSFPSLKLYQGATFTTSIEQNGNNTIFSNRENGRLIFNSNFINRLIILENGNIGISNSSPLDRLHIKGGGLRIEETTSPSLKLYQSTIFSAAFEQIGDNTAIRNLENGKLSLHTNNQERVTIDSTGQVGINIDKPQDQLHVKNGNVRIENSSVPALKFYRGATYTTSIEQNGSNTLFRNREAGYMRLYTDDVPRLSIDATGLVGIGANTPLDQLHVKGGAVRIEDAANPELKLYQGGTHATSLLQSGLNAQWQNYAGGNLSLHTLNQERVTIKRTGEVGIGTNDPMDKIHLKNGNLRIENNFPTINLYQGATLASKLEHNGNNLLIRNLEAGDISLQTNNLALMTIADDGNIGIGTSTPSQKLEVDGKIKIGDDAQAPTAGTQRYNSERKDMEFFNGSKWISMTQGEGIQKPLGKEDFLVDFWTRNPSVAIDDNGTIIIAYTGGSTSSSNQNIYISEYRNGSWTHPVDTNDFINPPNTFSNIKSPRVSMDNNGNAIIIWDQKITASDDSHRLFMSEYRNGSWTHPATINDYFNLNLPSSSTSSYLDYVVEMSDSGDALIAWLQKKGSHDQLYISEYRNGSWTHPANSAANISIDGTDVLLDYRIAIGNTASLVAWSQRKNSDEDHLYLSEYRNGSWTHPLDINDHISEDSLSLFPTYPNMDVAVDNNGNAMLFYALTDNYDTVDDVEWKYSKYFNGSWTNHRSGSASGGNITHAVVHAVEMGENNKAFVFRSATSGILTVSCWPMDRLTSTFAELNKHMILSPQMGVLTAINNNDEMIVTWTSTGKDYAATYFKDNWTLPAHEEDQVTLSSLVGGSFFPYPALNNNREGILVWSQDNRIYKARY